MATQSIWCQIYIATFLLTPAFIAANNIAHTHVTYVFGPSQGSYFGYSILAHSSPKSGVSLWVGAPKYSAPSTSGVESTAKHGMIYRCPLSDNTECTSINVGEKMGPGNNSSDIHSQLPGLALEACDFQKGLCGFYQRDDSDFDWVRTNSSGLTSTRVKKRRTCKNFRSKKSFLRITGPASYTVNDFYLNADSINANPTKSGLNYAKTILVSPLIKSTSGIVQCLRFCFNAFSHVTKTRRILKVWMTYNESLTPDIRSAQIGKEFRLFTFDGTRDVASSHWNYAEEDITGKYDGYYRLYFEARVFHNDVAIDKCGALGDIVITDIIVANLACGDEKTDIDEVETEQSLGLSLAAKKSTGDSNVIQIATCAPLWQHNCGYAKEANGICYELEANQTHVQTVYSHNPISQECIRGKIDVVLLVDQSGSVNQCNYQKVKGWLRNIIRSFNFGPSEQDIGVVVYSSPTLTKPVVNLGFEAYDNNGLEKKQQMLKVLTTLPYEAGKTYTGLALKIANDMLTGPNARPDAKKMMILLTDGATTKENTAQLDEQVQRARDLNTTVLAVGVGKFNPKELINIAGSKKNFFAVKKFSELEKVRDNLRGSVSSGTLEGSSTNMTSQDLQQCQLGFSAYYSKDSLRMGSPGCYSLGGNVISHGEHDHVQEPTTGANQAAFTTFQPQTEPSSFTEGNKNISSNITFDSTTQFPSKSTKYVVTSSHEESTSQFGDYEVPSLSDIRSSIFGNVSNSYFGYATTGGYYFGEKMGEFVASSAPRHQGNGSVLIFDSLSREGAAQRHFMIGLQYGEYFGATLCSEDFNSDGYTDLVVGAPLHSSRYSDEGRAYIYMGGQKMSASPDSILHGGKSRFGRFGKSISAVGDLNADGYPDLAVSAPLENNGVVYIYHGSRAGVITVDVQRLEPQLLKPQPLVPPMNFGETVEGKVDVDGNGYPDLIIGAPVTSSIIIMLTRPVVNVNLTIISSDEIDSRSKACMETGPSSAFNSCFNCSVCFLFHGRSLPTEILLQYNIYADVLQEKSRVSFTSTGQDHVTGSVKLFSQEKFYCHDYSLRMKPKVRDFMNPVALGLHYHLDDRFMPEPVRNVTTTTTTTPTLENSTLSSSGDYEYEGEEESKRKKRNVGDEKELFPILNMYNHKYYQTGVPFKTFCRNITQCIADVKLTTQTINKIGEAISSITVGRDRIIRIRVKVTNIGPEDAHDTRVTVIYSNKLYFNVLKKTDDTVK